MEAEPRYRVQLITQLMTSQVLLCLLYYVNQEFKWLRRIQMMLIPERLLWQT